MAHELGCGPVPLCRRGGRLTFLLLRQKQSKQKKRRPWCLRPSAALRATSGARFKWGPASTLPAQTIAGPDPLEAPLLGAYRRGLRCRVRIRDQIVRRLTLLVLRLGCAGVAGVERRFRPHIREALSPQHGLVLSGASTGRKFPEKMRIRELQRKLLSIVQSGAIPKRCRPRLYESRR